jgi:hypothetical protein
MARNEADREDLFTEAVGVVRRLEGRVVGSQTVVVAGFRADDVLVVYFDADPMLQFDAAGRLRRAFVNDCLFRAQGETLARLERSRNEAETTLGRHDLSPDELHEFRQVLRRWIEPLAEALSSGAWTVSRRSLAADSALETEIAVRLQQALDAVDWIAPALAGKR